MAFPHDKTPADEHEANSNEPGSLCSLRCSEQKRRSMGREGANFTCKFSPAVRRCLRCITTTVLSRVVHFSSSRRANSRTMGTAGPGKQLEQCRQGIPDPCEFRKASWRLALFYEVCQTCHLRGFGQNNPGSVILIQTRLQPSDMVAFQV